MASPPVTARIPPTGAKLLNPFPTTLAFSLAPGVGLWEKSIKPPGMDGREPIDIHDMFNTNFVTKSPRTLSDVTNATGKYHYRTGALVTINGVLLNKPGGITVHFADGSSWSYWGYLQKFTPGENSDTAEAPEADVEIVITNYDPNLNVEAGPIYTPASGTGT